jgi:hypothetical protein
MALITKSFQGPGFFSSIRAEMAMNRGMFAGKDGGLRFVCMDASFYRLKIFKKTDNVWFTSAAKEAASNFPERRVIANGQWFSRDYCYIFPCSDLPWDGEIIVDGVKDKPNPRVFGDGYWYFGELIGRSQKAFAIGEVAPSTLPIAKRPYDGLHPLNALVVRKKAVSLGDWEFHPAQTGKVVYGIHRASDVVFVVAQEDRSDSITAPQLATRLIGMGVDDAVLGDGSNSATLVVDGVVEVDPHFIKDNSMRVGPMFTLQTLMTQPVASKMTAGPTSTDSKFPPGTVLLGIDAHFSQTNSGMQVQALSLGITGTRTATQIMVEDLELPFGLVLTCPGSRLTASSSSPSVKFSGSRTVASLVLMPEVGPAGGVVGTVTVKTSRGEAVFDADWHLIP